MHDYSQLRSVPALLGMLFTVLSLYQFGAFGDSMVIAWFDYTVDSSHVMFGSLGIYALAFMSSETKAFENYEQWEQGFIVASPGLIFTYEYVGFVADLVNSMDPWTQILGFLIAAGGYGVAMR